VTARIVPGAGLPLVLAAALAACGGTRAADPEPRSGEADPSAGPWIAFEKSLDGNDDIWLVPAAGGPERRLTRHQAKDALPRWSPDGRTLLFSSTRSGLWQLWEVSASGGEPRRVRTSSSREWQADLAPDGRRIAFLSNASGAQALWIADTASGPARELLRHGDHAILGNPDWSPDGRRLVISSNGRLPGHKVYVVDAATGEQRRVSPADWGACEPRFGPDGRRVAYVRRRRATRDRSAIAEHDLETGRDRTLVDWPALNYDPAWSPDGTELAFASNLDGEYAIYRVRLGDGRSWRVTFGPGSARHPDYQPQP
jgi:Tol biopolymer transport system component